MSSIDTDVASHLLEVNGIDFARLLDLREPPLEAQIAHASSLEALRPKGLGVTDDLAVLEADSPACVGTQIKGQDRRVHVFSPFLLSA